MSLFYCFRYKKHLKAGHFKGGKGGYENYFSFLSEEVLAGLTDGENRAYRMPRSAVSQMMANRARQRLLEAHELLEKQGFRRSSVSLVDLSEMGLEVQPVSCTGSSTEVFFRFFTPFL